MSVGLRLVYPASRSRCGSRSCPLSSGSWSTCSAARAGVTDAPTDADREPGTPSSRRATRSYLQLRLGRVKAVNGWSAHRLVRTVAATAAIGAQILVRRPRPLPWGFAYAPRGPVGRGLDAGRHRGLHRARPRDLPRAPGASSHLRIDPEIEADGPLDPDRRPAPRARGGRLAPGAADPAGLDAGHRPAPRRGRAVGRPSQEVAPVREQGPDRRDRGGRRRGRPARRVLPDLSRDRRPGRLPHPDRGGLPRRLGRLSARPAAPGCSSPRPPTGSPSRRCSSSAAGRGSSSRTAG